MTSRCPHTTVPRYRSAPLACSQCHLASVTRVVTGPVTVDDDGAEDIAPDDGDDDAPAVNLATVIARALREREMRRNPRPSARPRDTRTRTTRPRTTRRPPGPAKSITIDQVLACRERGLTHAEIAAELGCSDTTISNRLAAHRRRSKGTP